MFLNLVATYLLFAVSKRYVVRFVNYNPFGHSFLHSQDLDWVYDELFAKLILCIIHLTVQYDY